MDYPIPMSTGSAENLVAGHGRADGEGSFVPILEVDRLYEAFLPPTGDAGIQGRDPASYQLRGANPGKQAHTSRSCMNSTARTANHVLIQGTLDDPASALPPARWEALANVYYWAVLALAAMAAPLWLSWRNPRKLVMLMVVAYYSFLFGFVFIGEQRFHSAIIPLLSVFAAVSLVAAAEQVRHRLAAPEPATPEPVVRPTSADEA
jgi:hypothetical protein